MSVAPLLSPVLLSEKLNQQYPFSPQGYTPLIFLNSAYIFLYQHGLENTAFLLTKFFVSTYDIQEH
jgi:hypothetical protein